ncbi:probable polygalacturonase [Phalaenopsis equestris]|uniref:probable polygalacturonase n=1 Tax=Phalaenopsis equestris TaxID=78828 RepID=UPI0009E2AC8B|nr:probable polygalacturonase [Phalaenopsis equestris]
MAIRKSKDFIASGHNQILPPINTSTIVPTFPSTFSNPSLFFSAVLMKSSHIQSRTILLTIIAIFAFVWKAECRQAKEFDRLLWSAGSPGGCRSHVADLTQFGGVDDGVTSNTKAFRDAIANLSEYASDGGSMLVVPPGRWLTGPFNLTSHFTLFLQADAEIVASTDMDEYPIVEPLPSYGRGRDTTGGRYSNFIWGTNLTDVIITGENATIDGQGQFWWDKFHKKQLDSTRGYLLELMHSENILISNLTFLNSPAWNLHPVYCNNVIISNVTVLAPVDSPNTDGIDPDSCSNVLIEDSFIVSGDDCIAVKSGWDEYGIRYGRPSEHILIRRVTCISPYSAVIALGSEMSGGIQDLRAENIVAINSESAVRIKTGIGRGGFVRDIFVRGMRLHTMKYVFWMTGNYGSHPDDHWDPNALPEITRINYSDFVAENVSMVGNLEGIEKDVFTEICISNVTAELSAKAKKVVWNCSFVEGVSHGVSPKACDELPEKGCSCSYPTIPMPIEDVRVGQCGR